MGLNRVAMAVVFAHLGVLLVHTAAHVALAILPQALDLIFILAVMSLLPLASVAFLRQGRMVGWVYLFAFAASFVYGALSHFARAGPDYAFGLPAGVWALVFQGTTIALAVFEALGISVGVALVARLRTPSGPAEPPGRSEPRVP